VSSPVTAVAIRDVMGAAAGAQSGTRGQEKEGAKLLR
jgi:hypothetical protein